MIILEENIQKLEELMKEFDKDKIINDEINRLLEEFSKSEIFKKERD